MAYSFHYPAVLLVSQVLFYFDKNCDFWMNKENFLYCFLHDHLGNIMNIWLKYQLHSLIAWTLLNNVRLRTVCIVYMFFPSRMFSRPPASSWISHRDAQPLHFIPSHLRICVPLSCLQLTPYLHLNSHSVVWSLIYIRSSCLCAVREGDIWIGREKLVPEGQSKDKD